jgi:hypothetical protein
VPPRAIAIESAVAPSTTPSTRREPPASRSRTRSPPAKRREVSGRASALTAAPAARGAAGATGDRRRGRVGRGERRPPPVLGAPHRADDRPEPGPRQDGGRAAGGLHAAEEDDRHADRRAPRRPAPGAVDRTAAVRPLEHADRGQRQPLAPPVDRVHDEGVADAADERADDAVVLAQHPHAHAAARADGGLLRVERRRDEGRDERCDDERPRRDGTAGTGHGAVAGRERDGTRQ